MAQIEEEDSNNRKHGVHNKRKLIRVDLTPMVDLGFLLITFFILTTALSQPTVANLIMPKDSPVTTPVKESAVLTLSLTRNDSIEYFEGFHQQNAMNQYCTFSNLRTLIQQKQKKVASVLGNRSETVLIIHPGKESTYKNFMDALDEIQINDVKHYYIMKEE